MLNAQSLRKLNASHSGFELEESDRVEGDNHLSGYLYKQSDHLKQWNLRYFCVMNSDHIKYYKKESDTAPKGFFSVAGCTFAMAEKKQLKRKDLYIFEVSHPLSKNVLRLGSYTPEVTEMWVNTLRRVAVGEGEAPEDDETALRLERAMNSVGTYEEAPTGAGRGRTKERTKKKSTTTTSGCSSHRRASSGSFSTKTGGTPSYLRPTRSSSLSQERALKRKSDRRSLSQSRSKKTGFGGHTYQANKTSRHALTEPKAFRLSTGGRKREAYLREKNKKNMHPAEENRARVSKFWIMELVDIYLISRVTKGQAMDVLY